LAVKKMLHPGPKKLNRQGAKPPRTDESFGFLSLKTWRSWRLGGEKKCFIPDDVMNSP
jgi:hypothetical protein